MEHPSINDTVVLIAELHAGQVDKLGAPYYFHPMRVMLRIGADATIEEKHAALLHDVLEDVEGMTADSLRERGYSEEVIEICQLLRRGEGEAYPAFIDRIISSGKIGAMRAKLADLYDNTNEQRAAGAPDAVKVQLASMAERKYLPAIAKLKLALGYLATSVISGGVDIQ